LHRCDWVVSHIDARYHEYYPILSKRRGSFAFSMTWARARSHEDHTIHVIRRFKSPSFNSRICRRFQSIGNPKEISGRIVGCSDWIETTKVSRIWRGELSLRRHIQRTIEPLFRRWDRRCSLGSDRTTRALLGLSHFFPKRTRRQRRSEILGGNGRNCMFQMPTVSKAVAGWKIEKYWAK
jgi:hypothetical protein